VLIGFGGSILCAPAMAGDFSAYGRGGAAQTLGDDPQRAALGDAAGDAFGFAQGEYPPRTATSSRSDPAVTRQQKLNDHVVLAERATNRM